MMLDTAANCYQLLCLLIGLLLTCCCCLSNHSSKILAESGSSSADGACTSNVSDIPKATFVRLDIVFSSRSSLLFVLSASLTLSLKASNDRTNLHLLQNLLSGVFVSEQFGHCFGCNRPFSALLVLVLGGVKPSIIVSIASKLS